ncbi:MAG: tRNA (adenosine(37)-N6)-threonylcarbamoyltransferase complex dimerization subunit type 1 TsaB [Clostridia bacterium]|nr:tRNA (adenosine(37)-N6)-threonylcarbamoyltransferase complex dimerization subunit type 1 TsaB [Clostridia bacterium]
MIVLGLDASSESCAVALYSENGLLSEYTLSGGKNHSVRLVAMIEEMLSETGLSFSDIDVYACGVGPGSFTGVRIGVATAKAFAQSHNKPMVAVSSLLALSENIRAYPGIRVAAVFARADELFCAAYDADGKEILAPDVLTVSELCDFLQDKDCLLCGNGAEKFAAEITEKTGGKSRIAPASSHVLRGGAVAELGYQKAMKEEICTYEELLPVYLRVSQAEREYAEKHGQAPLK